MEINARTERTLRDVLSTYYNSLPSQMGSSTEINYADNNVFNRFWQIDLSIDKIEFPVLFGDMMHQYCTTGPFTAANNSIGQIFMPIYIGGGNTLRRTGDSIINVCLDSPRIVKVLTNKAEVYYVGCGIIFDEEFQILMLCTNSFVRRLANDNPDYCIYETSTSKCYIHPTIFSDEDLLSKTILKKIVPFYLRSRPNYCEVIIKDMTDKLIIPSVPDMNTFSQESVNTFLKNNIEDITNGVLITKYL